MVDDFIDRLTSRLVRGAGLVMAAAIAAVSGAMAVFAFLAALVGAAWAHAIVAAIAAAVVAVWALAQSNQQAKERKAPIEERVADIILAHPTASFLAGVAAGALVKGKPSEARKAWRARREVD